MDGNASPFGQHLRTWRQRRRLSQLDLALEAEISARHLSFLETGRAQPSREMVLLLANQLETPLRDRNLMVGERLLSFISTTTVFGAATDVTLAEMILETFLPADQETADALRGMNAA